MQMTYFHQSSFLFTSFHGSLSIRVISIMVGSLVASPPFAKEAQTDF
jgi:hypothetical protein